MSLEEVGHARWKVRSLGRTGGIRRKLAPSIIALALAAVIGGALTTPVQAQESNWNRGHEVQRDHDNHHQYRQSNHDTRYYSRPAYAYAPPPVYYAPPPGPPVIDLVFPLRFR